jgi:putative transposase
MSVKKEPDKLPSKKETILTEFLNGEYKNLIDQFWSIKEENKTEWLNFKNKKYIFKSNENNVEDTLVNNIYKKLDIKREERNIKYQKTIDKLSSKRNKKYSKKNIESKDKLTLKFNEKIEKLKENNKINLDKFIENIDTKFNEKIDKYISNFRKTENNIKKLEQDYKLKQSKSIKTKILKNKEKISKLNEDTKKFNEEKISNIKIINDYEQKLNNKLQEEIDKYESKIKEKDKILDKHSANTCKKIFFYPNDKLKAILKCLMGETRYYYNKSVSILNIWLTEWFKNRKLSYFSKTDIAKEIFKGESNISMYDIKYHSIIQASNAVKGIVNRKKPYRKCPQMKFRKKKEMLKETIVIDSKHTKSNRGMYYELFNMIKESIYSDEIDRFSESNYEVTITVTRSNKYYICIPEFKSNVLCSENQGNILAIDPGVRTFATCFSSSGEYIKFGDKTIYKLDRISMQKRKIYSKIKQQKKCMISYSSYMHEEEKKLCRKQNRRINRLTSLLDRKQEKIQNKRNNIHNCIANYMVHEYDTIFLPKFNSGKMSRKERRNKKRELGRGGVRRMLLWNHSSFREIIYRKALETGCLVLDVDESYTTVTCGYCGIHNEVKDKKEFYCSNLNCNNYCDRDCNAARNIFFKTIAYLLEN